MSQSNGVIRIGRKGRRRFAFGDDGAPFEVDIVVAFQNWIEIDNNFRPEEEDANGSRAVPLVDMPAYHAAAVAFVKGLSGDNTLEITVAEALDFIARLREAYDDLARFFRPKSSDERASPDTSEPALQFSTEPGV